jgi:diguanylate cyclase (GGDEF)-like protein
MMGSARYGLPGSRPVAAVVTSNHAGNRQELAMPSESFVSNGDHPKVMIPDAVDSRADEPTGVRSRARWVAMATGMGALLVLYACWQVFHWTPGHRALVGDIFTYPFGAAAAWAAWGASKRCSSSPRLRSAWRLLTLAALASCAGEIAQTVYEAQHQAPFPSVTDVFFLSFYPLMLWGLLRFAVDRRTIGERVRLGLDLAVVAIGCSAVVLYLVLGPTVVAGGPDLLEDVFSVAYPVGDVVLLVGLASVLVREADPSARRALQFMAAGLLLYVLGDVIYGYISLHSTYHGGDAVDSFWVVALAMWALAGAAQTAPAAPAEEMGEARRTRASWAPYLASAVGFTVLFVVQRNEPFFPDMCLSITAAAIAALVSTRQYLAQRDLTSMQRLSSYEALHDTLTGLPNRALLIDRAERMLARARRNEMPMAALYLDIDGFKHVNDTFGHATGDELLRVAAARITAVLREADTVGRLGGDEFVVLLGDVTRDVGPELLAERICHVLAEPLDRPESGGRSLSVTASIGIALGRPDSVDDLFRDADYALYRAKGAGKNRWFTFEPRMLTAADDDGEFKVGVLNAVDVV